jgi:cytochrome c peroxidase
MSATVVQSVSTNWLGRVSVAVAFVLAASASRPDPPSMESFTRTALLNRFDANNDGELGEPEKAALRASFDGIDVPMLPDRPFDYTTVRIIGQDPAEFEAADNTPRDNPTTDRGATLGRVLFYDKQLSRNNTVACASCHPQHAGFADPRQFSVGFEGRETSRNAMSLVNLRYTNLHGMRPGFFWDERALTLEAQVLMPIQDPIEMGMELKSLEDRLQKLPHYPPLFDAAFGSPQVTSDRIAKALAQFLRSMVSLDSKFDRAAKVAGTLECGDLSPLSLDQSAPNLPSSSDHQGGSAAKENGDKSPHSKVDYAADFADFTAEENLGKSLFINGVGEVVEFGCAFCHLPPTFGMPKAFNNGLDSAYKDRGLGALGRQSNDALTPSNDGKFKASSLRNIERMAPHMHDGRFRTLEEVVEHYSSGVRPHPNLGLAFDEQDRERGKSGFKFTAEQKAALVAFLKTLTDDGFLSDPRFSDPFVRLDSSDDAKRDDPSPAEQYRKLIEEHEAGAEPRELAEKFVQLAETHPNDSVAVDALVWVLTKLRSRPEATHALELLARDHIRSEKLAAACPQIARVPSLAAEKLLRAALERSPHDDVRAQACLHLAYFLDQQIPVLVQLQKQPELADRVLQYYGKEYGQHLKSLNRDKLDKSREQVYERLLQSFADVPAGDSTMGEIATKSLFQIRHLSIGRVAPEIEGEDIFGERFKLSDYRGKVVVLSFWGHW